LDTVHSSTLHEAIESGRVPVALPPVVIGTLLTRLARRMRKLRAPLSGLLRSLFDGVTDDDASAAVQARPYGVPAALAVIEERSLRG
jgi:hypothetical protein